MSGWDSAQVSAGAEAPERYSIAGVGIEVHCHHPWLRRVSQEGMDLLRAPAIEPDLRVTLRHGPPEPPQRLPENRRVRVQKGTVDELALVRAAPDGSVAQVAVGSLVTATLAFDRPALDICVHDLERARSAYDPLYSSSVLFKSFLIEMLPRWGVMPLHASFCSLGQSGIIVSGPPRSGKTSLNLELCRLGCQHLADELGFIVIRRHAGSETVTIKGFPIRGKVWAMPSTLVPLNVVGRGSKGEYVFEPLHPAATHRVEPRLLIDIDDALPGSEPRPLDELERLQSLLAYDVFYQSCWRDQEMSAYSMVAEMIDGWAIPSCLVESPRRWIDLIESAGG